VDAARKSTLVSSLRRRATGSFIIWSETIDCYVTTHRTSTRWNKRPPSVKWSSAMVRCQLRSVNSQQWCIAVVWQQIDLANLCALLIAGFFCGQTAAESHCAFSPFLTPDWGAIYPFSLAVIKCLYCDKCYQQSWYYSVVKNNPHPALRPAVFWHFLTNGWEF